MFKLSCTSGKRPTNKHGEAERKRKEGRKRRKEKVKKGTKDEKREEGREEKGREEGWKEAKKEMEGNASILLFVDYNYLWRKLPKITTICGCLNHPWGYCHLFQNEYVI